MNTCKCDKCKGKKAYYSSYYHREEGFDVETQNHFTYFRERILKLQSRIVTLEKKLLRRKKK
jgi:hypothetical protein